MSNNIDARGWACPKPVIATKKALDQLTEGIVTTIVDNIAAKENVTKLAVSQGCNVAIKEQAGCFHLIITKGEPIQQKVPRETKDYIYLITQDKFGHSNDELGAVLIKSLLYTLTESTEKPATIIFLNSGVKLAVKNSPVLEHVKTLVNSGVQILVCGTCLDYYNLKDELAVGNISNMYTIAEELAGTGKVITI